MISAGAFLPGDILVLDNAAVHTGADAQEELDQALLDAGVEMRLLPAYSPELNPCEFVFARLKNFIRSSAAIEVNWDNLEERTRNFDELLQDAISRITHESLEKTYQHCRTLDPKSHIAEVLVRLGLLYNDM
jgi:transposase